MELLPKVKVVFLEGKFLRKADIDGIDRFLKGMNHRKALLILLKKMRATCCLGECTIGD